MCGEEKFASWESRKHKQPHEDLHSIFHTARSLVVMSDHCL
jgi:hypothetical protein